MRAVRKLFVVIDPTTTRQRALERAVSIAQRRGAALHLFLAVFDEQGEGDSHIRKMYRAAALARHEAWLQGMMKPLLPLGVRLSQECVWIRDWRQAIAPAAARFGADVIIKGTFRHSAPSRHLLKTSDWALLRNASCPVLLVKSSEPYGSGKILAAINVVARDPVHIALNDAIIEFSQYICDGLSAELHAVNAYSGSLGFIYPEDLARRVDVPRAQVHTADSPPAKLIPRIAKKLGVDVVVIGTVARDGVAGAVVGNTAEKVLDSLAEDVLVITSQDPALKSQWESPQNPKPD